MPLSETAKQSLINSEKINAEQQKSTQTQETQNNLKTEQERLKAQSELNAFNEKQNKLQTELNKQEQLKNERKNVSKPFDDKINQAIKNRDDSLNQSHEAFFKPGGGRDQGGSRKQFNINQNQKTKQYGIIINKLQAERTKAINYFDFSNKYPNQTIGGSVSRTFQKTGGQASLIALFEKQRRSQESQAQRSRQSSITTARSRAIQNQTKIDKQIKEFENNRNNTPIKQNAGLQKLTKTTQTTALKKKPQIKASSFFREYETSAIPSNINGTTKQQSEKAFFTFTQTQKQQKQLFEKLTNAQSSKQALKIRSRFRESNPYVGTANIFLKGGIPGEQFGFIIEKKLSGKFETDSIKSKQATPKLQAFNPTITPDKQNALIPESTVKPATQNIQSYIFLDEDGNTKSISQKELFSFASYLIDKKPQLPTKTDKKINLYLQQNKQKIKDVPTDQPGAFPIQRDFPFESEILNYGTEARASITNIVKPEDEQEKFSPSLESQLFEDLIGAGKSAITKTPLEKSKAYDWLSTKLKTPEGQQAIAGSLLSSMAGAMAFIKIPSYGLKVFEKTVTAPKTKKIAQEISNAIIKQGEYPQTEKMLSKFPKMPDSMKQKIREQKGSEIVGIEMLDSRTALIKRGTELNEVQTPYIVVRNIGKKARGELYSIYNNDKPGAFKKIIVSGVQNSELKGGVKIGETGSDTSYNTILAKKNPKRKLDSGTKKALKEFRGVRKLPRKKPDEIVSYPATRENVLQVTKTDKLARVGTAETVGIEGLKETPLSVIEKIESQEIKTGSIITETERLNPVKSLNKKVQGLISDDTTKKIRDPFKPQTPEIPKGVGNSKNFITVDLPNKAPSIITKTEKTTSNRRESLEKIIKQTEQAKPKPQTFTVKSVGASIGIVSQNLRQKPIITTRQESKQTQSQDVTTEIKTQLKSKQEIISDTITDIKTELDTHSKQKPFLDPKYSLILAPGQKRDTALIPRYILELTQKTTTIPETIVTVPPKTPITKTVKPGAIISLNFDEKKEIQTTGKKSKPKILFYRWNVNTDEPGQYLPTRDLSTGRKFKVIQKVDKLERKVNKPGFWTRVRERENKYFQLGLNTPKRQIYKKSRIPQISPPKLTKKEKKKGIFNLNFGF